MSDEPKPPKEKPDYAKMAADAGLSMFYVEVEMRVGMMVLAEDEQQARFVAQENFHEEIENQEIDGGAHRPVKVTARREVPEEWRGSIPYAPEEFRHDGEVEDYLPPGNEGLAAGDGGDAP